MNLVRFSASFALHLISFISYNNFDFNISAINLVPLIGSDELIENFVLNFKESIHLYITSSFTRFCLEDYWNL